MELFDAKYPIELNDFQWLNVTVKLRIYEYITYTNIAESMLTSKNINLLEDKSFVTFSMENFREKIYKYINHSHTVKHRDLQFKQSCDLFPKETILLVVDFEEKCTFTPQIEIQSEYYHSD